MSLPLLTGCVSQAAAGGGGIPAGITARDNLAHWWKMNEGSTTAETDYGLGATADTGMVMSGVTSNAGGPSANGTPDFIEFDGVADDAYVLLVDSGGTYTAAGNIVNKTPNTWSFSLWLKDESTTNTTYKTWFKGGDHWSEGFGVYAVGSSQYYWINVYNGYRAIEHSAVPTSGWRNIVMTFPDVTSVSGKMSVYFDGIEVAYKNLGAGSGITTQIGQTANSRLSLGCSKTANGTENYHQACSISDVRIYDRILTGAEITAIAAGDW